MILNQEKEASKQMKPILSICIPTYNRCGLLYFTLKSIVEQDIFKNTNDVEIVVSDNCSTDFTEQIVKVFTNQHPTKIKYNKNETNIVDKNFEKVLSLASGEVLKLHNDNFLFNEGSLEKIVDKIKELSADKPMIFFSNGNSRVLESKLCSNLNEFVDAASYLTTWIAAFSIWKEDFDNYEGFAKNSDTLLTQTDVLLNMCAKGKKMYVFDEKIFNGYGALKKGGYNISKIFGKNYLTYLNKYVQEGLIDEQIYEKEKRALLLNHIIPMKFSTSLREKGWVFKNDGYWRHLAGFYWYNAYFYTSVFKIFRHLLDAELNLIGRKLNKKSYQKYWRKRNEHNSTTIDEKADSTKVFVGKNAKGHIKVISSQNESEVLIIDNDAIIEEGTVFNLKNEPLIIFPNPKQL